MIWRPGPHTGESHLLAAILNRQTSQLSKNSSFITFLLS